MVNVVRNSDGSLNVKKTVIDNPTDGQSTSLLIQRLVKKFNTPIRIIDTQQETADGTAKVINQAK